MNRAYTSQQVLDPEEDLQIPPSSLGWDSGTTIPFATTASLSGSISTVSLNTSDLLEGRQLGGIDAWADWSTKFDQQVAQQDRQLAASRLKEQQQEHQALCHDYVFPDASAVRTFLSEHRSLPLLLLNAVPWLKTAFGEAVTFRLQLLSQEDEPTILCCLALWTGSLPSAQEALRRFDENWWLDNCRRASGNLIFDFELS